MKFEVVTGRSAVLVKARSNVGPISFATTEIEGSFSATVKDRAFVADSILEGRLVVSLTALTSGNQLYDTELRRRIDTRRFPSAVLELQSAAFTADTGRYDLVSSIEIHDVTRTIGGSVSVDVSTNNSVVIRGQQTLDVREFGLEVPTTLALKIYPDVWIEMHLEGQAQ